MPFGEQSDDMDVTGDQPFDDCLPFIKRIRLG